MSDPLLLTFDAGLLARGWLATSLATGSDESVPVLYGTLLIETYSDGVRLTATDRYMALTAWVSAVDRDADDERALDEAPNGVVIVRDPDGRGKALLTYLRKVAAKAAKDETPAPQVTLAVNVPADDGAEPGFPGMELRQVVLDYPEHEKLTLPIVQGEFPAYRSLLIERDSASVAGLNLAADLVNRLGQAAKALGGWLQFGFSGPDSAVAIEIIGALNGPTVRGVVMPIRSASDSAIADEDAA